MKNFTRFSAPVLVLIWTAYYFAKRSTGGLIDTMDIVVCGCVASISIIMIIIRAVKLWKKK